MSHQFVTEFGSLDRYEKGWVQVIDDNPKHYVFSNVFEVAGSSRPYEKIVVARNIQYVMEAVRAEGRSPWFAASHDEFALVMDGQVEVEFIDLADAESIAPSAREGTVLVGEQEPAGKRMGRIRATRGHQVLLPKGAAYRFNAAEPGVLIIQTISGDLSVEKWAEICQQ